MTQAEWAAQLEACGGNFDNNRVLDLVFKDGPNALWKGIVDDMHVEYKGVYDYLANFFPTRVWEDWNGVTELGSVWHDPYIPFDMGIFQRSMQICDLSTNDECHTDYCEIPEGGMTALPKLEMYKTGFKTKPICIADIRTSQRAKEVAERIVRERFKVDEQVMNIFYTLAVIRMLGHKWVLEYSQDGSGRPVPVTNNNPYNILGGYRYNYMQPLFPQVGDINNIMPLSFDFLDQFGSALTLSGNRNNVSSGSRGEPIFELWHSNDWYRQEVLDNPEYLEKARYFVDPKTLMLSGYTNETQQREVVGNFAMKQMINLPRFTQSTQGGLTVVQPFTTVDIDVGTRPLHNHREWNNAPILMTVALGKGVGEILTRPALATGIEGKPIMPITGNGDWVYRNDYDKECNDDLNRPHFRKRYEMGFQLKNPDAGWGFLSRAKKFRLRPINTCDLQPIFSIAPVESDCSILTVGCNPLNDRLDNNIIETAGVRKILCSAAACGNPLVYRLSFQGLNIDSISPNQNPLGCDCGDEVTLLINDEDGVTVRQETGTLMHYERPNVVNVHGIWFVELEDALAAGECISGVSCPDASPTIANVISCIDNETDPTLGGTKLRMILDSLLVGGELGDTVAIKYYSATNVLLGTKNATISLIDYDMFRYEFTSTPAFECDAFEGQVTMTVTVV